MGDTWKELFIWLVECSGLSPGEVYEAIRNYKFDREQTRQLELPLERRA